LVFLFYKKAIHIYISYSRNLESELFVIKVLDEVSIEQFCFSNTSLFITFQSPDYSNNYNFF